MKKGALFALLLVGLTAVVVGGAFLWPRRPWRAAVVVNERTLTAGELDLRARALYEDARRVGRLSVPGRHLEEAQDYYRRRAAKMWIVKEVLLAEALTRGFTVSASDEKESLDQIAARLRGRNLTPEQFFREGPLPEDLKRRDFWEGVLVDKFTAMEVRDKISVTTREITERQDELQRQAQAQAKPGAPKVVVSRKKAIDSLRVERFRRGFRRLFRELYAKSDVKCPAFHDLETLDGVMPKRLGDSEPRTLAERP